MPDDHEHPDNDQDDAQTAPVEPGRLSTCIGNGGSACCLPHGDPMPESGDTTGHQRAADERLP